MHVVPEASPPYDYVVNMQLSFPVRILPLQIVQFVVVVVVANALAQIYYQCLLRSGITCDFDVVESCSQETKDHQALLIFTHPDSLAMASLLAAPNRLKIFWSSFCHLRDLTPQQVDDFMASYVIYSLDWADEKQMIQELGPDYKEQVGACLGAYYAVLNHLCALGELEKMYIPPSMDMKASILDNQLLYEESIADHIELKAHDKVLDLGCGRGRVAAHMTEISGAEVTGLNIDSDQIAQARSFNKDQGFPNNFVQQDFNQLPLPFENNTFDAFYQIQALSLCKDIPALFKELARVLKPGAKISLLDWVSLPAYDPLDPEHAGLMRRVKPLIGAVGTPTPESLEWALKEAGFTILRSDNASIDDLQTPLIAQADDYFRLIRRMISGLVAVRILPPHFEMIINRLCLDGEAFKEMDTRRLITTSYRIIAQRV